MGIDYIADEVNFTNAEFNLYKVLDFQLKHEVQVLRGEDFQYLCYIDKKVYGVGLTFMYALVRAIDIFSCSTNPNN